MRVVEGSGDDERENSDSAQVDAATAAEIVCSAGECNEKQGSESHEVSWETEFFS